MNYGPISVRRPVVVLFVMILNKHNIPVRTTEGTWQGTTLMSANHQFQWDQFTLQPQGRDTEQRNMCVRGREYLISSMSINNPSYFILRPTSPTRTYWFLLHHSICMLLRGDTREEETPTGLEPGIPGRNVLRAVWNVWHHGWVLRVTISANRISPNLSLSKSLITTTGAWLSLQFLEPFSLGQYHGFLLNQRVLKHGKGRERGK